MASDYFDILRALSQPIRSADLPQTLDHVQRLLDVLGKPQQHYPSIVVAGSTGKGTTCLRIAGRLRAQGLKVGLYTSPHLHLFRERFTILDPSWQNSSRVITQVEFVMAGRAVLTAERALDQRYSTFESATALALYWFAQQQIDAAVLEIGIGGRFDAVNAVENALAVFTPIEAEHVAMLGGSLESVAWHKAGIIQRGGKATSVTQVPQVMGVLEREAREKGADLEVADDLIEAIRPFALDYFWTPAGSVEISDLPGRVERIIVKGHAVLIDGGHTPAAAHYLRQLIGEVESMRLVVGMLRDKNAAAYLNLFDAPNVQVVYTHAPGDRALTPEELLVRYPPTQASVLLAASLDEALNEVDNAREALFVVAGSLRMAAAAREAYGLLTPDDLEEARLTRAIFAGEDYQRKIR